MDGHVGAVHRRHARWVAGQRGEAIETCFESPFEMTNAIPQLRKPERRGTTQTKRYTRPVPTVHREGPYRFFFYSADRSEPSHVHVERDANRAKIVA
jgi:uncharacterized protein DUF4160